MDERRTKRQMNTKSKKLQTIFANEMDKVRGVCQRLRSCYNEHPLTTTRIQTCGHPTDHEHAMCQTCSDCVSLMTSERTYANLLDALIPQQQAVHLHTRHEEYC